MPPAAGATGATGLPIAGGIARRSSSGTADRGGDATGRMLMLITAAAFIVLYWQPLRTLVQDWWSEPDAGHGLLLAPLAIVLAGRAGLSPAARGQARLGLLLLAGAVLLRYVSGLAAEFFTMRLSLFGAALALVVYAWGLRQLRHWWMPALLLFLAIPLPQVLIGTLALPLQLQASQFGALLLEWRHVPVLLQGNVIRLPGGHSLFVTEACSGLRSLTALLALGVLIGGIWLRRPGTRLLLILLAIPIAMLLNGLRIFLTGFLVFFVNPALGEGIMHVTEGWVLFLAAFLILGTAAGLLVRAELLLGNWRKS